VAGHFEWEIGQPILDVRLGKSSKSGEASIRRTSVKPRNGNVGEWTKHFDRESCAFFAQEAGGKLEELGYGEKRND
jgi:hypothetical protein